MSDDILHLFGAFLLNRWILMGNIMCFLSQYISSGSFNLILALNRDTHINSTVV